MGKIKKMAFTAKPLQIWWQNFYRNVPWEIFYQLYVFLPTAPFIGCHGNQNAKKNGKKYLKNYLLWKHWADTGPMAFTAKPLQICWQNCIRNVHGEVFFQLCVFLKICVYCLLCICIYCNQNMENNYIFCYQLNRLSGWDFVVVYFVLACTNVTAILSLYKFDSNFELEIWWALWPVGLLFSFSVTDHEDLATLHLLKKFLKRHLFFFSFVFVFHCWNLIRS